MEEVPDANPQSIRGRRLAGAAVLLCAALLATLFVSANLDHHPQIFYPHEAVATMQGRSGVALPKKLVDDLRKRYNLPEETPTCVVGKHYGALCQDGTFTLDGSEGACVGHLGVKSWVEYR